MDSFQSIARPQRCYCRPLFTQALQRALTASRSVKVRASGSSGSDAEHVSGYVDPSDVETARAGSASPASSPAGPAPEEKFRWEGASLPKLAAVIAVGLLIAFIPWKPAELTNQVTQVSCLCDTHVNHECRGVHTAYQLTWNSFFGC